MTVKFGQRRVTAQTEGQVKQRLYVPVLSDPPCKQARIQDSVIGGAPIFIRVHNYHHYYNKVKGIPNTGHEVPPEYVDARVQYIHSHGTRMR